jgi:hypothetical protein
VGDGEALGQQPGRHSDLLPLGQSVLAISASRCATRQLASRLSKTKPTSVGGGCETMRHLDDVTQTQGRRPIGNPKGVVVPGSYRSREGIGPAACLLSYGTWAAADPRSRSSSCL